MNQLTVMLNGNGGAGGAPGQTHHQTATTNQFFTFTGQSTGQTITLDPSQVAGNVAGMGPQLVTFQQQPTAQGNTMMLPGTAFHTQQQHQQAPGTIQYFITQPTHHQQTQSQQPQQILTSTQSQPFGIVQNLLAPGMGAMIPVNQPLAGASTGGTNGATIQIAAAPTHQTLQMAANQPGQYVTMTTTNQPTGTAIQFNPHQASQLFHPQATAAPTQFQFQPSQGPALQLANSAITITPNPSHHQPQMIQTANGQQFILNQNVMQPAITTNPASQPIYQFVLPNGQVIQSSGQLQTNTTLISPQLIQQQNATIQSQQHQPTAITVPIQSNLSQPMSILGQNLTLNQAGTTTFITQQPQHQQTNLSNQSISNQQQSTGQLLLTSPVSSGLQSHQQQQPTILLSPHSLSSQSLLIPAVSTAAATAIGNQPTQQQHQQSNGNGNNNVSNGNNSSTTAMVVLTQSIPTGNSSNSTTSSSSSLIPNAVLDHKSIKSETQLQTQQTQPTLVLLTSPKMKLSPTATSQFVNAKLVVNGNVSSSNVITSTATSIAMGQLSAKTISTYNGQTVTSGGGLLRLSLPKQPKPAPIDQSTQCDDNPAFNKMLEETQPEYQDEEDESQSQCSERTQETTGNVSPSIERPSRPSSTSSCGSLKIAEDEIPEEEEVEEDDIVQEGMTLNDNDTENNDAFSTETELDNNSVQNECQEYVEQKHSAGSVSASSVNSEPISTSNQTSLRSIRQQNSEDKEGYQSSYGSPCHFTDTEDEEEEEEEAGAMENHLSASGEVSQEMKLVRKNGLTKAAYDLINNRLMGSDCGGDDQATNDSAKSSVTSALDTAPNGTSGTEPEPMEEEPEDDEMSNDSAGTFSLQMQTPSPSGSNASGLMEPESTTHMKETTISQIAQRWHMNIDLDPIRDFAKRFKLFRLARGLTQSQVCQDLTTKTDGQSYSQSAICRFEKMDITPKSAIKIKPVLESWMKMSEEKYPKNKLVININGETSELENAREGTASPLTVGSLFSHLNAYDSAKSSEDEMNISSLNSSISLEPGKKRKKRTSFAPEQLDALNRFFDKNPKPSSEDMTEISRILGSHDPKINRDVVRVWFCNKRQALKVKRPNYGDSPTPPPTTSASSAQEAAASASKRVLTFSKSVPQTGSKTNSTFSSLQMSISASNTTSPQTRSSTAEVHTKTLLGMGGTLTFPYPSAVSAIPLTLSTGGSASGATVRQVTSITTVPKNSIVSKTPNGGTIIKGGPSPLAMSINPINLTQFKPHSLKQQQILK